MKMTLCIFLFVSSFAFAGGMSTGGGENHAASDSSAWFLGEKVVHYCVELDPAFGVTATQAVEQIEQAFSTWREYINTKGLNLDEPFGTDADIEKKFKLGKIVINTQAVPCDGREDLKFLLGVTNAEVRNHINSYAEPIAFAQRTSYDEHEGWGRGFVWIQKPGIGRIKPDVWKIPFLLQGVLLHEIGHVLGNSHVGDTIMDEMIPALAGEGGFGGGDGNKGVFTRIDNRHELYLCQICDFDYQGEDDTIFPEMFEFLSGRKPEGAVRTRLHSTGMVSNTPKIMYELSDDSGSFAFELKYEDYFSHLTIAFGDTPVFKKSLNYFGWSRKSNAATYLLFLTTKAGKKVQVLMARNMGVSPISLQLLSVQPGWIPTIFEAQTY